MYYINRLLVEDKKKLKTKVKIGKKNIKNI